MPLRNINSTSHEKLFLSAHTLSSTISQYAQTFWQAAGFYSDRVVTDPWQKKRKEIPIDWHFKLVLKTDY